MAFRRRYRKRANANRPKRSMVRRRNKARLYKGLSSIGKTYTQEFNLEPFMITNVADNPTGTPTFGCRYGTAGTTMIMNVGVALNSHTGFDRLYDLPLSATFSVLDIATWSTWRSLFDAYRIKKVYFTIEYLFNSANLPPSSLSPSTAPVSLLPTLFHSIDMDDADLPIQLANVTGKPSHRVKKFGNQGKCTVVISPRSKTSSVVASPSGGSLTLYQGASQRGVWFDTRQITSGGSTVAPVYYGWKGWLSDLTNCDATGQVPNVAFRIKPTYIVEFKTPMAAY